LQTKRTNSHSPLKISRRAPPDNAESPAIRSTTQFGWLKKPRPTAPYSVSGGGHATAIATGIDYQEGQNALTHHGELQPVLRKQEVQVVDVNVVIAVEVALGIRRILDAARPVVGARSGRARNGVAYRFAVHRNGPRHPIRRRASSAAALHPLVRLPKPRYNHRR
jgi:hypothetical protein